MKTIQSLATLAFCAVPCLGEMVTIWNTFQSEENLVEVIYQTAEAEIGEDTEFPLFPSNPPGTPEGGFYDIDISYDKTTGEGKACWTLKDNLGASHLVFPAGSFDRYYLEFEDPIDTATLESTISSVTGIPKYEEKVVIDVFGSGLVFPSVVNENFLTMYVVSGANLTETEQMITVKFTRNLSFGCRLFGSFVSFLC